MARSHIGAWIRTLFWAGQGDVYYQPLSSRTDVDKHPFILATGDHVSEIFNIEPATICKIYKFLTQAVHQNSV